MATVVQYQNLNFGRPSDARVADVLEHAPHGDVSAFVELREWLPQAIGPRGHARWYRRVQGHRHASEAPASEGALIHPDAPALVDVERTLSVLDRRGWRIGWRQTVEVVLDDPELPGRAQAYLFLHLPPRRMTGAIRAAYGRRLRARVNHHHRLGRVVSVFADWNELVGSDPCSLEETFGGRWYGSRIDGVWVDARMQAYVHWHTEPAATVRRDRHPLQRIRFSSVALTVHSGKGDAR